MEAIKANELYRMLREAAGIERVGQNQLVNFVQTDSETTEFRGKNGIVRMHHLPLVGISHAEYFPY
ncbi:MAG: hypothetical protein WCP89_00505 [archaeon]